MFLCVWVSDGAKKETLTVAPITSHGSKKGWVRLKRSHRSDQLVPDVIYSENTDDLHPMFPFNFLPVWIFHHHVRIRVMRFQYGWVYCSVYFQREREWEGEKKASDDYRFASAWWFTQANCLVYLTESNSKGASFRPVIIAKGGRRRDNWSQNYKQPTI